MHQRRIPGSHLPLAFGYLSFLERPFSSQFPYLYTAIIQKWPNVEDEPARLLPQAGLEDAQRAAAEPDSGKAG